MNNLDKYAELIYNTERKSIVAIKSAWMLYVAVLVGLLMYFVSNTPIEQATLRYEVLINEKITPTVATVLSYKTTEFDSYDKVNMQVLYTLNNNEFVQAETIYVSGNYFSYTWDTHLVKVMDRIK